MERKKQKSIFIKSILAQQLQNRIPDLNKQMMLCCHRTDLNFLLVIMSSVSKPSAVIAGGFGKDGC